MLAIQHVAGRFSNDFADCISGLHQWTTLEARQLQNSASGCPLKQSNWLSLIRTSFKLQLHECLAKKERKRFCGEQELGMLSRTKPSRREPTEGQPLLLLHELVSFVPVEINQPPALAKATELFKVGRRSKSSRLQNAA